MHAEALRYLDWLADTRKRSPHTVRAYECTLRALEAWGNSSTLPDLEAFVHRPRNGKPPAAATIARDVAALKSFSAWRVRAGISGNSVAASLFAPTIRNIAPRAIADDTWTELWLHPKLPYSYRSWLGLAFFGGLRRAELVALQSHHLLDRTLVSFVRKGNGDHTLPIGAMLDVYGQRLPHLFPELLWPALECAGTRGPLVGVSDAQRLARLLDRAIAIAGVPRFTLHQLRHSCATNLLRAGVPLHLVSRLLGHSNPATTMRYVRASGMELTEWLKGTS